ncbi:Uncharacterized protein APZ42_023150 [Daphnia magna]|uniref:Uncharacterized protein n=1 Tax=Daphnia magna TaxID=35525 RepID=A0A164V7B6_9CRUS|nr:Uncharacterized protein APZ42_023150 [Daphnia magna]
MPERLEFHILEQPEPCMLEGQVLYMPERLKLRKSEPCTPELCTLVGPELCILERPELHRPEQPRPCTLELPEPCMLEQPELCMLEGPELCMLEGPELCMLEEPELCRPELGRLGQVPYRPGTYKTLPVCIQNIWLRLRT